MTGKELREKREMYGETQEKAATRMGVSKRTLIRWEAMESDIPGWASDKVTGDKVTSEVTEGDKVTSGSVTSDINVTSVGDTDVTSYVPLLEASIIEELRKMVVRMGEQMSEMKEAVDLLRHRVKGAEDEIKELKAELQSRPRAYVGESAKEPSGMRMHKASGGFPKPGKGWRSYDKPGGGGD